MDRNYSSPRSGQSSRTQTKITEHIKTSLRTIRIKFLLVITTRYKTKYGTRQVSNTVPSPLKVTLYRAYGNNRTWRVISIIAENKLHAHHETHLHTMKVVTILIPQFPRSPLGRLGPCFLFGKDRRQEPRWAPADEEKETPVFLVSLCYSKLD